MIKNSIIAIVACLTPAHAAFASGSWSLPFSENRVVMQDRKKMDCGPAAIFNSLSLGNEALKSSIKALPGNSTEERYTYVLENLAQKQSVHFADEQGTPRTVRSPGGGTFVGDTDAILKDLVKLSKVSGTNEYTGGYSYRRDGEKMGQYLGRIHGDIVSSIEQGYPPVISRAYYAAGMRRTTHYVVIFKVSEIKKSMGKRFFVVSVYDSIPGNTQDWRVEESDKYFKALSWEMNRPGMKPVEPVDENGNLMSPFLLLTPEDFAAAQSGEGRQLNRDTSSYLILEILFGRVQDPRMYEIGDPS